MFNLGEVRLVCEVDSYVRRAIARHIDVFTKEGFAIKGDPEAVAYLRKRFALMAFVTGKPFDVFISECVADFIKYHNVFLVKGRFQIGEGFPGMSLKGISDKTPVSAYFKVAPPTMSVARMRIGNEIIMWMQTIGEVIPAQSGQPLRLSSTMDPANPTRLMIDPRNMVHMYKDREEGEIFGTPFILPVIPDIKVLREVEQHVVELVYLYANPIVEWTVGTKEHPGEDPELAVAEQQARDGGVQGMFIIPGDQQINIKGAPTPVTAIDYLKYFEQRAFTGLGTSDTQMGRSATSSRSAAGNMTNEFFDRVRGYHRDFEAFFTCSIIYEMLMEGGFDPFDEEETCWLEYFDPDAAAQIERENQAIQMYTNYLFDIDESRRHCGYDPWDDETQDERGFFKRVKLPLAVIQAIDEPWSSEAKAAMKKTTGVGGFSTAPPAGAGTTTPGKARQTAKPPASKTRPKNQTGVGKPRKGKGRVEMIGERISETGLGDYASEVAHQFSLMRRDIVASVRMNFKPGFEAMKLSVVSDIFQLYIDTMKATEEQHLWSTYLGGVNSCLRDMSLSSIDMERVTVRFGELLDTWSREWGDYTKILFRRLNKNLQDATDEDEAVSFAQGVFEVLDYISESNAKTHFYHARNYGYAFAAYALGAKALVINHNSRCPKCGQVERLPIDGAVLYKIPPFHRNCECEAEVED